MMHAEIVYTTLQAELWILLLWNKKIILKIVTPAIIFYFGEKETEFLTSNNKYPKASHANNSIYYGKFQLTGLPCKI